MIKERRGLLQALVTAIATKPFLLFAGISGSGKTQLARRIAAGLAAGIMQDQQFKGMPAGGKMSARNYKETLAQNGVIPELNNGDPGDIINVFDLDRLPIDIYKHSGLEKVIHDRIAFLPVRPDWSEPQKLWGFYNPLTGLYYPTAATRVAMHAFLEFAAYGSAAPRHFIILDELNLARVEYYLSDILSLMECPTTLSGDAIKLGELVSIHPFNRPIWTQSAPQTETGKDKSIQEQYFIGKLDHSWALAYHYLCQGSAGMMLNKIPIDTNEVIFGASWNRIIPPQITFTPNLTIIGTVNIDETTHGFSPKVLDRAFVFEFNEMHFDDVCSNWNGYNDIRNPVALLYQILKAENLHFGYRAIREILEFIEQNDGNWENCGDFVITSKILPKLRGGEDKLRAILPQMLAYAIGGKTAFETIRQESGTIIELILKDTPFELIIDALGYSKPTFPLSAAKLYQMTRQLLESGLASFF